ANLYRQVQGFDRSAEIAGCRGHFGSMVLVRHGRIRAYATAPWFWPLNHGVAEDEADMRDLLLGCGAANPAPLGLLLPSRQAGMFRWCLANGLRAVKPMSLMSLGLYHEPRGTYYPS